MSNSSLMHSCPGLDVYTLPIFGIWKQCSIRLESVQEVEQSLLLKRRKRVHEHQINVTIYFQAQSCFFLLNRQSTHLNKNRWFFKIYIKITIKRPKNIGNRNNKKCNYQVIVYSAQSFIKQNLVHSTGTQFILLLVIKSSRLKVSR